MLECATHVKERTPEIRTSTWLKESAYPLWIWGWHNRELFHPRQVLRDAHYISPKNTTTICDDFFDVICPNWGSNIFQRPGMLTESFNRSSRGEKSQQYENRFNPLIESPQRKGTII
jgi:hypothetical protein